MNTIKGKGKVKIAIDRMAVFSYNSLYNVKALKHKRFKARNYFSLSPNYKQKREGERGNGS